LLAHLRVRPIPGGFLRRYCGEEVARDGAELCLGLDEFSYFLPKWKMTPVDSSKLFALAVKLDGEVQV
jgi:hypothetical protein